MNTLKRKLYFVIFLLSACISSCNSQQVDKSLSSPWLITLTTADVGVISTVMQFDVYPIDSTTRTFDAYAEKDMDTKIFGYWKAHLGRVMGSGLKNGSLVRIVNGRYNMHDSLTGVLATPFGNYYIRGRLSNDTITGRLCNGKMVTVGYINGKRGMPALPIRNYRTITQAAFTTTERKLYDPALLKATGWQQFAHEMNRVSSFATDDAAYVMAFFYYSSKLLPFSHYSLYRPAAGYDTILQAGNNVALQQQGAHTMVMRIASFGGGAEEVDSAFAKVCAQNYDTLIVDLRDNPGGGIEAGMAFVQHLVRDTVYGGVFLTQQYFSGHTAPPAIDQYKSFLHFSAANYHLLLQGIATYPAICLLAYPRQPVYKGKIYILTNGRTASTCEPIVYMLQQQHLATIAGERTAGAMLNGEHFAIQDGFFLTVPTATYYTSDGFKIDGNGVAPNVKMKAADALDIITRKTTTK